ncbi:hypothetical protein DFH29DRAFT_956210 [Suillus ampliporus]|nr:hypothetical protein DFH29DRAFT_956210 [Suillus ampliporus]
MKAAIGGLLAVLQTIDTTIQNKADLNLLTSRLHQLICHISNAPIAWDPLEKSRRDVVINVLHDISDRLMTLRKRRLGYASVTQVITGCSNKIDRCLLECLWSSEMQSRRDIQEILAILQRRDTVNQSQLMGRTALQLPGSMMIGCVTLVDATGHEHPILVDYCTSFQQLNKMLEVLFERNSIEAQVQKGYMKEGRYDLCIDEGTEATQLTIHEWPKIEAGTKIVMRVVIEQPMPSMHQCHICGAWSDLDFESLSRAIRGQADYLVDCRGCKRRFRISVNHEPRCKGAVERRQAAKASNIDSDRATDLGMYTLRVQQIVRAS